MSKHHNLKWDIGQQEYKIPHAVEDGVRESYQGDDPNLQGGDCVIVKAIIHPDEPIKAGDTVTTWALDFATVTEASEPRSAKGNWSFCPYQPMFQRLTVV